MTKTVEAADGTASYTFAEEGLRDLMATIQWRVPTDILIQLRDDETDEVVASVSVCAAIDYLLEGLVDPHGILCAEDEADIFVWRRLAGLLRNQADKIDLILSGGARITPSHE